MTFRFRTLYTYCGPVPTLIGKWYMIETGPDTMVFQHHQNLDWKMRLTHTVAAKVFKE